MKKRNFVSLSIFFAFVAISVTGLLLYFGLKSDAVEIVHVLFGLFFTGAVVFHIVYNFPSVKNYTKDRKTRVLKIEFIVSFLVGIVLLVLMCSGFSFMEDLSHAGRSLTGHGKRHDRVLRREGGYG